MPTWVYSMFAVCLAAFLIGYIAAWVSGAVSIPETVAEPRPLDRAERRLATLRQQVALPQINDIDTKLKILPKTERCTMGDWLFPVAMLIDTIVMGSIVYWIFRYQP